MGLNRRVLVLFVLCVAFLVVGTLWMFQADDKTGLLAFLVLLFGL